MTKPAEFIATSIEEPDFVGVAELLTKTFGGSRDVHLECFSHWWDRNPARREDHSRGWLVRSPSGDPIAFTANIPFRYFVNGREGVCFATGSTSVHEQWRGRHLSKLVGQAFLDQSPAAVLVGTGSTDVAAQLWLRLGMKPLNRTWPRKSYRVVGNVGRWVDRRLGQWPALSAPAGAVARSVLRVSRGLRSPPTRSLKVLAVDSFEPSSGRRIEGFRASINATTFAVRNPEILNWMYFGCRHVRESRAVFAAMDGAEVAGYLAMKRVRNSFYMLECRCRDADPEIARGLFDAARDYAEQRGAFYIAVWRYTDMIDAAAKSMIGIATASPPMMTYCYLSKVGPIDEQRWESTPGDGDLSVN